MTAGFDLVPNALGRLVLKRPDEADVEDVRPRPAFPWTAGGTMISVRDVKGKELLLIERLSDLPGDLQSRVHAWMADNAFVPAIRQVKRIENHFGYHTWSVVTDRGPADFRMQEREDVRFLPGGRFTVKDTDGNVYLLPPVETLDEASRVALRVVI